MPFNPSRPMPNHINTFSYDKSVKKKVLKIDCITLYKIKINKIPFSGYLQHYLKILTTYINLFIKKYFLYTTIVLQFYEY